MKHLNIELTVAGDLITAIGLALDLAKAAKQDLHLTMRSGKILTIHKDSNVQDLISIAVLENKLSELERKQI